MSTSDTQHPSLGLPRMVSIQQAADAPGVSHWTISDWIRRGRLPAYKVGERRVMLLGVDVEAMVRPVEVNR